MVELRDFYNSYHSQNRNKKYKGIISRNNFTYFYVLNFLDKKYIKRKLCGKVMDVGCGVGSLSLYFSNIAKFVLGLDVSNDAVAIANKATSHAEKKNVIFRCSEIVNNLGKFDLIICSEVIEHIKDEEDFLGKIHHNLKSDGLLFISTPSRNNVLTKIGYFKIFDQKVGHLRRYSEADLRMLLNSNGFEIVEMRTTEGLPRLILYTTSLGHIIRIIRGPFIKLFHFIDELSTFIFGAHDIQLIARKK